MLLVFYLDVGNLRSDYKKTHLEIVTFNSSRTVIDYDLQIRMLVPSY